MLPHRPADGCRIDGQGKAFLSVSPRELSSGSTPTCLVAHFVVPLTSLIALFPHQHKFAITLVVTDLSAAPRWLANTARPIQTGDLETGRTAPTRPLANDNNHNNTPPSSSQNNNTSSNFFFNNPGGKLISVCRYMVLKCMALYIYLHLMRITCNGLAIE